jgi:hypothetical protein
MISPTTHTLVANSSAEKKTSNGKEKVTLRPSSLASWKQGVICFKIQPQLDFSTIQPHKFNTHGP